MQTQHTANTTIPVTFLILIAEQEVREHHLKNISVLTINTVHNVQGLGDWISPFGGTVQVIPYGLSHLNPDTRTIWSQIYNCSEMLSFSFPLRRHQARDLYEEPMLL